MKVYLELEKNANKDQIIKKISRFKDTSNVYDAGNNLVVHLNNSLSIDNKQAVRKIEKKYKLLGIKTVIVSPVKVIPESPINIQYKNLHCFFDIDSTLTKGNGVINKRIREIFEDMKNNNNMRIYFVSGRNIPQIRKDMTEFDTEPYSIAENGGVLIGVGRDGDLLFGDRKEPDAADIYLKSRCPNIKEDIGQGFRKTERIYLQTSKVSRKKFDEYVTKSKAKVEVQASKNSYHVSKKAINKGSAVEKLTCELRFGRNDIVVAVGDADMDESMIKNAQIGFAVGNASPAALKAADVQLTYEHDKGIKEMYDELLILI